jgi:hypothetical protein
MSVDSDPSLESRPVTAVPPRAPRQKHEKHSSGKKAITGVAVTTVAAVVAFGAYHEHEDNIRQAKETTKAEIAGVIGKLQLSGGFDEAGTHISVVKTGKRFEVIPFGAENSCYTYTVENVDSAASYAVNKDPTAIHLVPDIDEQSTMTFTNTDTHVSVAKPAPVVHDSNAIYTYGEMTAFQHELRLQGDICAPEKHTAHS